MGDLVDELAEAWGLLGIPPGIEQATVSRAYRRLARATHPDVSTAADAAQRFADMTAAYRLAFAAAPPVERVTGVPGSRSVHVTPAQRSRRRIWEAAGFDVTGAGKIPPPI